MTSCIRAEWRKIVSVPSTVWTLLVTAVTAVGSSLVMAFASAMGETTGFEPLAGVFVAWAEYPVIAIGVFGALAMTTEFGTGQIRTTLLAHPRRSGVLVAKAVVVGAISLALGVLLAWTVAVGTAIVFWANDGSVDLASAANVRAVCMAGVALACIALMALGVGALVRHTAGAVILFPALLFLPLATLSLPMDWLKDITRFSPLEAAFQTVSPTARGDLLPIGWATVVLLLWPVLCLTAGAIVLERRDV
ncbi:hypothetical protein [Flexivirga sp. B27]